MRILMVLVLCAVAASAQAQPRDYKVVHVFVALCDNKNQGVAPVPAAIGNGQDPKSNLYWGAMYGCDAFFRKSEHWQPLIIDEKPTPPVIARSAFISKGPGTRTVVIMEAYDGGFMKSALTDFLTATAGGNRGPSLDVTDGKWRAQVKGWGCADLVAFVGHNGLMDVKLDAFPERKAGAPGPSAAVILACKSSPYFREPLRKAGCPPLITTAQFMAPEAYTLDAIIRSWAAGDKPDAVRERAAEAYAKYQKCPLAAARGVFVAGTGD